MKRRRILVTGGAGFIGSHLVERLCQHDKVTIFDNLRRNSLKGCPHLKRHPNVRFIKGDIMDPKAVNRAVRESDIVLHLAAIAGVSSYYSQPAKTLEVNLIGTINVLESCKASRLERFIYFSTSEVYGPDAYDAKEGAYCRIGPSTDYRWSYAVSKFASEHLVSRSLERLGISTFVVRPFNIYGPRQTGEGAISNFISSIVANKPIMINGDGSPIRSWCYISDCVDAVISILKRPKLKGGTFNIGNPRETYSTLGLARLILDVTGKDVPVLFRKMEKTEIVVRVPNIDKAREVLSFEPRVTLRNGLISTYEYFKGMVRT